MTDDLVKRLRLYARRLNEVFEPSIAQPYIEAADRIEALEMEQRRLYSENLELKELIQSLCDYTGTTASTTWIRFDPQPKWHLKETEND